MLLRLMLLMLLPFAAYAQSKNADEYPWTRIAASDLDKFEANVGELRVNNFALELSSRAAPAGTPTLYEFSASVVNRSKADRHILIQIIGIKADATPSLSSDVAADVENRHSEALHSTLAISERSISDTVAYYIRVLSTTED